MDKAGSDSDGCYQDESFGLRYKYWEMSNFGDRDEGGKEYSRREFEAFFAQKSGALPVVRERTESEEDYDYEKERLENRRALNRISRAQSAQLDGRAKAEFMLIESLPIDLAIKARNLAHIRDIQNARNHNLTSLKFG